MTIKIMVSSAKEEHGFSGNGYCKKIGEKYAVVLEIPFCSEKEAEEVLHQYNRIAKWVNIWHESYV